MGLFWGKPYKPQIESKHTITVSCFIELVDEKAVEQTKVSGSHSVRPRHHNYRPISRLQVVIYKTALPIKLPHRATLYIILYFSVVKKKKNSFCTWRGKIIAWFRSIPAIMAHLCFLGGFGVQRSQAKTAMMCICVATRRCFRYIHTYYK